MRRSTRKKIIIAVILVVAIIIALAGYWWFIRPVAPAFDFANGTGASSSTSVATRTLPAGQLEYRDAAVYHFSLFYPQELAVKTYSEGGGAATIDFQNVKAAEGFQIFIVPYIGTSVSAERFKEDEPSGVRKNPTYGLINGASAASFYSTDASLGDTYEVWFIHDGYLYEVTTLKPLDTWLQTVMQSWVFI